jgi:putative CocE/NonD family hydrolase
VNRRTAPRRRALIAAVVALGLLPLAPHAATAAPKPCGTAFPRYAPEARATGSQLLADQAITMSDGTILRADVALPTGLKGPFPVALTITGYGKSSPIGAMGGGGLVQHGYATVNVDDRGTGSSGGTWDSWSERTQLDYREVLDWIVRQRWSDDRIGITGGSYMGITSLFAAATGHPAVKAVFANVPMADPFRDIVLPGGQLNASFIPAWTGLVTALGLQPTAPPDALLDHVQGITQFQVPMISSAVLGGDTAYDGPFWRQRSPIDAVDRITVPTFIVGGLDDIFQRGEPMLYERLADHTDARLIIGPWTHISAGTGLPRDGVPATGALTLQWFDQHVRGIAAQAECIPHVTQFVRGHDRYESASSWPVPGLAAQRWHLRGNGGLTPSGPRRREPSRSYTSLPITGLCTRSTAQWLIGAIDAFPCATDNRVDEVADGLTSLVYTSSPMATESVINGPIQADLWVTTTGRDAVVSVSVSDVAPDGTSRGLTNGLLVASHRAVDGSRARLLDGQSIQPWHPFTLAATKRVVPGQPMLLPVEVFPTSAAIAKGHRLRITVTPYDVPHALPPIPAQLDAIGGQVTVLSDAAHPSSVVVPVVAKRR